MSNTFGSTSKQFALIDPRCVRENRSRFRRDLPTELGYANSYYSLSGRWPDVGWLLLDRASYDQLDKYSSTLRLVLSDYVNGDLIISNVSIVQAQCVTRGLASDPNAIYLIQVTNNQGVLYSPWGQFPVNSQYNVRVPAYDGSYYAHSLNSGTPWTWDTMVGDLWAKAPSQLGTYPHLPITPLSVPENYVFVGEPLWPIIQQCLNYIGLTVAGEYPNFSIVVPGNADSTFTALQSSYAKYLEDDLEYIDGGSGRVPSSVVVYFHRRNQYYGTEETTPYTSNQWQAIPAYSVTVSAPSAFASSTATYYLWDNFTVRYDIDNNPLAADVAQATAIAQQRVTEFFATIFRGTQGFMKQVYSGVLPFTTGSLVDGVRWFNTGTNPTRPDDDSCGWRTEIIRGFAWPEVTFPTTLEGLSGPI